MTFLSALLGRFTGYAAALGALLAIFLGAILKARAEGKSLMREEQERHRRETIAIKRKLDDEIDNLGHADLDHRFGRWVRKDGR